MRVRAIAHASCQGLKYDTFNLNSKPETIIYEKDSDDVFESVYNTIMSNIKKSPGKGSGLITDSVIDHNISISKYNPLASSSYTKLAKRFD